MFVILVHLNQQLMRRILFAFFLVAITLFTIHCKDDTLPNSFIPDGPVSLVINTDLPEYYHMKTPGNYVYQPGGNRGVIVIHNFDDTYISIERTCSHNPDETCSHIYVDSANLTLRCGGFNLNKWQACCDSKFLYSGQVSVGPAQYPLRTYYTRIDGSVITVKN